MILWKFYGNYWEPGTYQKLLETHDDPSILSRLNPFDSQGLGATESGKLDFGGIKGAVCSCLLFFDCSLHKV